MECKSRKCNNPVVEEGAKYCNHCTAVRNEKIKTGVAVAGGSVSLAVVAYVLDRLLNSRDNEEDCSENDYID